MARFGPAPLRSDNDIAELQKLHSRVYASGYNRALGDVLYIIGCGPWSMHQVVKAINEIRRPIEETQDGQQTDKN